MSGLTIRRRTLATLILVFAIQLVCALFFVGELATEVFGLRHWALDWQIREILQVGASLGLVLGAITGALLIRHTVRRVALVERQVRAARGEFFALMEEQFLSWGLSRSERDVALFAVRGFSNAEIAELRGKSEATIKTQMNAVLRKAGASNRAQLISQLVEVLMVDDGTASPAQGTAPRASAQSASEA